MGFGGHQARAKKKVESAVFPMLTSIIMRPAIRLIYPVLLGTMLCGCATLDQYRSNMAREQTEADQDRLEFERMRESLSEMKAERQSLYAELEQLRRKQDQDVGALRQDIEGLRKMIQASDASSEQMRKDMVDQLSKRMAAIVSQPPASGRATEQGYEHVVQPGETLSQIAAAYHVKPDAIVRANSLKSANTIRVGQKLFIPESEGAR